MTPTREFDTLPPCTGPDTHRVVQRFRSDLGLYVHLHLLVPDSALEECTGELPFRAAPPPTPERMTAILGRVDELLAAAGHDADDLDLDARPSARLHAPPPNVQEDRDAAIRGRRRAAPPVVRSTQVAEGLADDRNICWPGSDGPVQDIRVHDRADGALRWALISLAVSLVVLVLKLGAWHATESAVLLADAAESLLDLATASFLALSVRLARRPADPGHPFGHGKAEYFSAGFQGALVFAAGVAITVESVIRLGHPPPPLELGVGALLSAAATVVNLALALALLRAGTRHRSPALTADGYHNMTDVYTTLGGWFGLLLAWATGAWIIDPIFALLVAANILWTGFKVARGAIGGLMDASLPADEIAAIEATIRESMGPAVEFHDLRTRRASHHTFVEFHLVVDGATSVHDSHALCDAIEERLLARLGVTHTSIHVEPESESSRSQSPAVV